MYLLGNTWARWASSTAPFPSKCAQNINNNAVNDPSVLGERFLHILSINKLRSAIKPSTVVLEVIGTGSCPDM